MTKKDFVKKYASKTGVSQKKAEVMVGAFLDTVEEVLKKGSNVQFVGWGNWSVRKTSERKGRNPRTGQPIKIPAKKLIKFKAGKKLISKINH